MSKDPKALLSGLFRKQKRQVAAANAMVESAPDEALRQAAQADFTRESVKLKAAEKELQDFCKQTGFQPDTSRVWVNGFGRSVSQRAVHANKKAQRAIINQSRTLELFNAYDIPDTARITPQAVIDDLTTTEIGRDVLKYLEEQEVRPRLTFSAKSGGIRGEEQGGEIIIYLSNCKDVKTAVCTIIHECTHRKYGIGQSQWAECVCVAQEIMHRRGRNYLTESERRAIIKAVKDAYPEYNWRKGGIIRGRRSQSGR
ncbi:MAG: hypothetical protein IJN57_10055 [Oscillospiraceae bacterium]|nr:hypothetical protein [Oscillospiraceae bacterium]